MLKKQINIGSVYVAKIYVAKISGRLVRVQINSVSNYGGWNATNLDTNRQIRIKSAAKLRKEVV